MNPSASSTSSQVQQLPSQYNGKIVFMINGVKFEVDERYVVQSARGSGAYGFVVSALDKHTGKRVAIKKIQRLFHDLVDGKRILREIRLLASLKHENIISVKDVMEIPNKEDYTDTYIVSELMDTDLQQVIRSKQKLSTEHIQYFLYQLLRGLKYIHSAKVLHRDLKPSNILVNGNCELKICDFGLARGFHNDENSNQFNKAPMTEYVVTRWFRAPELLLLCQDYTDSIDLWSVGCIFGELLNRKPVFPGKDYLNQLQLITDALGTPGPEDYEHVKHAEALKYIKSLPKKRALPMRQLFPHATEDELDLLSKMLVFNPKKRISAADALQHPYLRNLHDEKDEPVANHTFSFEYDDRDITEPELRRLVYEESLRFHPGS